MDVLGFDIGGTKCAVILAHIEEERVEFLERTEIKTVPDWNLILGSLAGEARSMLLRHAIVESDCRIGISCGGPLDSERGLILSPPNLPCWDRVPVTEILSRKLSMPAVLRNDADACALAEWRFGAGKGSRHMIFLTFGTGLGAGLILNGQLYTGACGMAGEVGHIRMEADGPAGYGKTGSLEGFCSGGGIGQLAQRKAKQLVETGRRASYHTGSLEEITAKAVAVAAARGEADALEVYRISGSYFGKGLSVLIDLLNPEIIVAGSIFTRAEKLLRTSMEAELVKEALPQSRAACKIVPSALGERIGDYGAVVAAL